jgi:hypothetical protein
MATRAPRGPRLPGLSAATGRVARVRKGVDATIRDLRKGGRLEPVDAALLAIARTLADAADAEHLDPDGSRYTVSAILGKLVPVVGVLRGDRSDAGDGIDAELLALVGALRDAQGPRPSFPRPVDTGADHPTA